MSSSDCTFEAFEITAREGVGNVHQMMGVLQDALLPATTGYNPANRTMKVRPIEEADPDMMRDVIGLYASQLEDTKPFMAETENFGEWFWQIKDGKYRQTDALTVPNEAGWNDGSGD
jgi:hypothetical protein